MGALTHVALFAWKPGTTEHDVSALGDGLATLPGLIPEIRGYRFGPDAGLADGNVDYAVVADFDDVGAFRAYVAHPAHRDVIDRLLTPILARRSAAQVDGSAPGRERGAS